MVDGQYAMAAVNINSTVQHVGMIYEQMVTAKNAIYSHKIDGVGGSQIPPHMISA